MVRSTSTKYLHLGGDEVVYGCWENDKSIDAWMIKNGFTSFNELFIYFIMKVDTLAYDLQTTPIHWEEVYFSGANISKSTLIQVWTNSTNIELVTAGGYKVIASPQEYWYADHLDTTWQEMYEYDPTVGLPEPQQALVIGGEVELWGEHIDFTNIQQVLYPRASSVGRNIPVD